MEHEKKEQEIGVDFSKIKSFFSKKADKGNETHNAKQSEEDESLAFDPEKLKVIGKWLLKYSPILLILIPLLLSTSIRMQNIDVPITDRWAADNVVNFIRADATNVVNAQYPNLPNAQKEQIINEQIAQAFTTGTYQIRTGQFAGQQFRVADEIARNSQQLKTIFQYEANGKVYTYMPDIDPYTYLRYAENILDHGYQGDRIEDGLEVDVLQVAPIGKFVERSAHPHVLAWLYKIMHVFNDKITTMQAAGYFGPLMIILTIIPMYFILYALGASSVGSLAGTIFFATNATILGRSAWGHADTDPYNVFFPMLISACILLALNVAKRKNQVIFSCCAGISFALFWKFWGGWWFFFDLAYAAFTITFVLLMLKKKTRKQAKDVALVGIVTAATSYVLISLWNNSFTSFINETLRAAFASTNLKDAIVTNLWPNVYTTVAELNPATINDTYAAVGGKFFFILTILGAVALVAHALLRYLKGKESKKELFFAALIVVWIFGMVFASSKGIRFVFLGIPAYALGIGCIFGYFYTFMKDKVAPWLHIDKRIVAVIVIVILALFFYLPGPKERFIERAYTVAQNDIPIVNDGWYNTLTSIRENSQEDAIITSWWDFGHHFKYFSRRAVTFDGASQNQPMAHWVGKLFRTDNEKEAVGILRMLDCGSRTAFEELERIVENPHKTKDTLDFIVTLSKQDAKEVLAGLNLDENEQEHILELTHCSPPEAFVIASGDMIGKSGVWAHFGGWDFTRARVWLLTRENVPRSEAIEILTAEAEISEELAGRLYDEARKISAEDQGNAWISNWPNYNSNILGCAEQGDEFYCSSVRYNAVTNDAVVAAQQGEVHPVEVITYNGTELIKRQYNDSQVPVSVVMIPTGGGYQALLAAPELGASVFTRQYFFQGKTLKYFELFKVEQMLGNQLIYTYKVNWEKFFEDIGEGTSNENADRQEVPQVLNSTSS